MSHAYSVDLRQRVVDYVLSGHSCASAGERFGVSESSAIKWTRRYRETKEIAPKKLGGDRRSKAIEAAGAQIFALHAAHLDITLSDLQQALSNDGLVFSTTALFRFLKRHGLTLKKSRGTPVNKAVQMS